MDICRNTFCKVKADSRLTYDNKWIFTGFYAQLKKGMNLMQIIGRYKCYYGTTM